VRPTRVWPWPRRSAATAEESTPPDMATAIVSFSFWGVVGIVWRFSLLFLFSHFWGLGETQAAVRSVSINERRSSEVNRFLQVAA
jgi:hypothetical protein